MAPKEYFESYFRVSIRINFFQSSMFIIESVPLVEDIVSGILGSGVPAAIAGRMRFKYLMQYDTSSSLDGLGMLSIAWIIRGVEASSCSIELKKQVLPIFTRVRLNRKLPEFLDSSL